jgi:isopenicillin N synthase-like dioxygenase
MIPRIDLSALTAGDARARKAMARAATEVGFATVHATALDAARIELVLAMYRAFFTLPEAEKAACDMARTGSNRGWGAPGSEQVDPNANPDYKQVFDSGVTLPPGDPRLAQPFYAANVWPDRPAGFAQVIGAYYTDACAVAMQVLRGLAAAIDTDAAVFERAFDVPMALLRGNYYPARPAWAGTRDFGIAAHTDYGCLTLLATDGSPGLEVQGRDGGWIPVSAPPGEFVINFGEMMETWTGGTVRATPHRVVGGVEERLSVPLFFNPAHDTNVAPLGAAPVLAGEHLSRRYNETYVHLQAKG